VSSGSESKSSGVSGSELSDVDEDERMRLRRPGCLDRGLGVDPSLEYGGCEEEGGVWSWARMFVCGMLRSSECSLSRASVVWVSRVSGVRFDRMNSFAMWVVLGFLMAIIVER
jgi:hypothetical protein